MMEVNADPGLNALIAELKDGTNNSKINMYKKVYSDMLKVIGLREGHQKAKGKEGKEVKEGKWFMDLSVEQQRSIARNMTSFDAVYPSGEAYGAELESLHNELRASGQWVLKDKSRPQSLEWRDLG